MLIYYFSFFCSSFYFRMHPCHVWSLFFFFSYLLNLLSLSLSLSSSFTHSPYRLLYGLHVYFAVDGNTWAQVIALYPTLVECITCSSPEVSSALKEALGPFKDFMQPPVAKVQNGESWSITSHKLFIQPEPWMWRTTHTDLFLPQRTFYCLFSWKPLLPMASLFSASSNSSSNYIIIGWLDSNNAFFRYITFAVFIVFSSWFHRPPPQKKKKEISLPWQELIYSVWW